MKRLLLITGGFALALLFISLMIVLREPSEEANNGKLAVELNEIEHKIANGETEAAKQQTEQLRRSLSEKSPETEDKVTSMRTFLSEKKQSIFYTSGICILFLFLLSGYCYFTILRPFNKLSKYAGQIAEGDLTLPLSYERSNYFGKFTWAFDHMRQEIVKARACEQEAIENNKTVIASLSHDIKTPVASIRAYVEGLEAGMAETPELRQKYSEVIMSKCDEVTKLTDDMFLHSLTNLKQLQMNTEQFELVPFLEQTVEELTAGEKDVFLCTNSEKPVVNADRKRMKQLVENLIHNARKYAKTKIEITVAEETNRIAVSFRDFGGGIPDEELPFVFDKFFRGKNSKEQPGAGLGLYIVKYITEQSGGTILVSNKEPGLEIRVYLPKVEG